MKKLLIFLGGVVTGVLLTFLFAFVFSSNRPTTADNDGIKMFEKPGDVVNEESFEVFQVLAEDAALVRGGSSFTTVYLLTNDEGKYYYDDEEVKVPKGKVARQIGIYQYQTRDEFGKTVPIVRIMEK